MRIVIKALLLWGCFQPQAPGNDSCANSTCHGSEVPTSPAWNRALSTWYTLDPHAGAGRLLHDADARRIVRLLEPSADDSDVAYDNVLRQRCISCHASVSPTECAPSTVELNRTFLAEGVSCESCHGVATDWIDSHVASSWNKEDSKMRDTASIVGRAETCVRCHVGSRTEDELIRDVNHDLLAAGHPALRFDLLVYNENMPKHWDPFSPSETQFNTSAVRIRRNGRRVSLEAAGLLSSLRADHHLANRNVPWPELADYDCFACHQALSIDIFSLPADAKSKQSVSDGLPVWNSWYTIGQIPLSSDYRWMLNLSPHRIDANKTVTYGANIGAWARGKIQIETPDARTVVAEATEIIQAAKSKLDARAPLNWYEAVEHYLMLDAAVRDLANNSPAENVESALFPLMGRLEGLLRFDPVRQPGGMAQYHSPASYSPEVFRTTALQIISAVGIPQKPANPNSDISAEPERKEQ